MFTTFAFVHAWLAPRARRTAGPSTGGLGRRRSTGASIGRSTGSSAGLSSDRGQTTAEYALVLVAVAAIALLVLAWATESGAIGKLFDFILSHIMGQVH
jgi:hypothetical protein